MTNTSGVLLCGHGSRDPEAATEFEGLARAVAARLPERRVAHAFLEFALPTIAETLTELRRQGVRRVLAVPALLFAAGHAKNDMPSVLNDFARRHPDTEIRYGRELGLDPKLLRAAGDRVRDALAIADREKGAIPPAETLLLTVGRGASDPDANGNVAKVGRMLWEGLGLGWGEVAYSGVTFPLVAPALQHAAQLGFRRIVVFPYFLFTGVLVGRIRDAARAAATAHPGLQIATARYLGDHPLVVETVLDRVRDIEEGRTAMNCSLCKYRDAMLGFEDEIGLPQAAHHRHVEGIGAGPDHAHDHAPGHGHHHPYPHADHPLGPRSLARARRS